MAFDIAQIDAVLSTTRAVRLRLDLERQVPDEIITRCIDLAEQAPSGGNITSRRWLVIRDPEVKAQIAHLYREAGGASMIKTAERLKGSGTHRERTTASAAHLAQIDGESLLAAQPGVTVEVDIAAPARRVWELVTDINLPSRFSDEFQGAEWVDADGPRLGASFVGRNKRDDREWQTTSFVVACDPPRVFAWNVSDPERPGAQWRFELDQVGDTTRLRQCMTMGPGMSGTSRAMENEPDKAQEILAARRETLRRNMELTTQGIKRLAESAG